MDALNAELRSTNICAAVQEVFDVPVKRHELHRVFGKLQQHVESNVIILWASAHEVIQVLNEAIAYGLVGKTWIISETTGKNTWFHSEMNRFVGNVLLVVPVSGGDDLFEESFLSTTDEQMSGDVWMHGLLRKLDPHITTEERRNTTLRKYRHMFDFTNRIGSIDDAVRAYVAALENYLLDKYGCRLSSLDCEANEISNHEEFVKRYLSKVRFQGLGGNIISFDVNGDYTRDGNLASYELYHVRKENKSFALVAHWSIQSSDKSERLNISDESLASTLMKTKSRCSEVCEPGSFPLYKIVRVCCWTCVPCAEDHVKSYPGNGTCEKCPENHMSNPNRTQCGRLHVITSTDHKSAYLIYTGSTVGLVLTICTIVTLMVSRKTPIVRATNLRISLLQLCTLLLLFVLSLVLVLTEDTSTTCVFREYGIWFLYTLVISVTLAKSSVIYHVFHMKTCAVKRMQLEAFALSIIASALLVEVFIIICLTQQQPINLQYDVIDRSKYTVYRVCNRGHSYLYQFTYTILLQLVCGWQSFRSRRLPENYNEAAHITFAAFSSAIVIASGIPIVESRGGHPDKDLTMLVVTTCSNLVQLLLLYGKKCATIYCEPGRNTRAYFQQQRVEYIEHEVVRTRLTRSPTHNMLEGCRHSSGVGSVGSVGSFEHSGFLSASLNHSSLLDQG